MNDIRETTWTSSDTSVVIPMFNESAVITEVVTRVRTCFESVVCVDDGSRDDSAALAERAGATVVRHPVNLGQGAALQTGLLYALRSPDVRYFVTFDADGQHDVRDAIGMVSHARASQADVVLGSRFLESSSVIPPARRAVLRAGVAFTRLTTGLDLTDTHNGLRVLNRRAAESLKICLHGMAHASEILEQVARLGLTHEEYPMTVEYTEYSRSKGQPSINALNVAFDLLLQRLRTAR